jgi:hypothetical protein
MKKIISNGLFKNIACILGYWVIFVIIPFLLDMLIYYHPPKGYFRLPEYTPIYIVLYILFAAPLFYFIPYSLAKPKTILAKFLLIFLGLVVPYLFIYMYTYITFNIVPLG